jgi:hypothetical protein
MSTLRLALRFVFSAVVPERPHSRNAVDVALRFVTLFRVGKHRAQSFQLLVLRKRRVVEHLVRGSTSAQARGLLKGSRSELLGAAATQDVCSSLT